MMSNNQLIDDEWYWVKANLRAEATINSPYAIRWHYEPCRWIEEEGIFEANDEFYLDKKDVVEWKHISRP